MQKIIFTTKYYCELCKNEQVVHLYGSPDSSFTKNDEPELIEWARHYHWIDAHRVCAVCGKLVQSNQLELMVNDGKVAIADNYTDEYKRVERGNKFGNLLIVHERCMEGV